MVLNEDADEFIDRLCDPTPDDVSLHVQDIFLSGKFESEDDALTAIKEYLRTVYGEDSDITIEQEDGGFGITIEYD